MAEKKKVYSYIKHPFCKNGWYSFGVSLTAFIITQIVAYTAVKNAGNVSISVAAAGLSAVLLDLVSFLFTSSSFREKGRNYTFAIIGGVLAVATLAEWAYILSR